MSLVTSFGLKCTVSSIGQSLFGWMFGSRCLYAGSDGGASGGFGRLAFMTVLLLRPLLGVEDFVLSLQDLRSVADPRENER